MIQAKACPMCDSDRVYFYTQHHYTLNSILKEVYTDSMVFGQDSIFVNPTMYKQIVDSLKEKK
jgi:hypothetical protein